MEFSVFDHFPEPVFYIADNQIRYSNPAALELKPEWKAPCVIPEELSLEPDCEGVFSCTLVGREFQVGVTRDAEGRLLVLRCAVPVPRDAVLSTLPVQLREMSNGVQAAAELLAGEVKEHGEEVRRNLAVLNQNFYRLLRVTRHLELAQRCGGEHPEQALRQTVDIALLCREVSYSAEKLAEKFGAIFKGEVPGGGIPSAGDKELLEIMLLELVSNALKAAGKGGEAGLTLNTNGNRILITVWDNGPGMTQAELTAVMDGSSPERLPKPGTGLRLGLPIARYAAAAHGGTILLESREGCGLNCTVSLPKQKPSKGKAKTPRVNMEEGSSTLMTFLSDALPWQVFDEE